MHTTTMIINALWFWNGFIFATPYLEPPRFQNCGPYLCLITAMQAIIFQRLRTWLLLPTLSALSVSPLSISSSNAYHREEWATGAIEITRYKSPSKAHSENRESWIKPWLLWRFIFHLGAGACSIQVCTKGRFNAEKFPISTLGRPRP